jgi:uncharacterized membrane protein
MDKAIESLSGWPLVALIAVIAAAAIMFWGLLVTEKWPWDKD